MNSVGVRVKVRVRVGVRARARVRARVDDPACEDELVSRHPVHDPAHGQHQQQQQQVGGALHRHRVPAAPPGLVAEVLPADVTRLVRVRVRCGFGFGFGLGLGLGFGLGSGLGLGRVRVRTLFVRPFWRC